MAAVLEFFDDPATFLKVAGDHLALDPVLNTVVATIAERECRDGFTGDYPHWYAVARTSRGDVAGVAMRTAPFRPYPLFVLPMPEPAARGLAAALHERGEDVGGANGALPAARQFAEESARLAGRTVEVQMHTRLFELREVVPPPTPNGELRPAGPADTDLALEWFRAFHHEADEQAGRPPADHHQSAVTREDMVARIESGGLWFWEVDGERVHLTGANPPSFGAARIGPVFTPQQHRGHGYASATVAAVSQHILDGRARPCLFTDQANPVSNAIYQRIGYAPVADMVNLLC
jgi:GNAT superfamily N-acetyltransferase